MKMIREDNTNIQAKQNDKLQMSTRFTNKYHDANTVTATNVSRVSDPFAAHNLNLFSRNSFGYYRKLSARLLLLNRFSRDSLGYSRNILRSAISLSIRDESSTVYILVLPKVLGLSALRANEQSTTRFKQKIPAIRDCSRRSS
jgi:hypothetical protein